MEAEPEAVERAIRCCVEEFYRKGRADPLLGPVFNTQISDWDLHLHRIANFWSKMLLGTDRYSGAPFPLHMSLPITPAHIAHWVDLFAETAHETLPKDYADKACAKAQKMGESFIAGLFPFNGKGGKPARHP